MFITYTITRRCIKFMWRRNSSLAMTKQYVHNILPIPIPTCFLSLRENPCPLCIPTRWTKTITSRYVCSRFWNDTLARNSFSPKRYLHSNYSRCTFISLSTVVCATTNRHIRNRFLWNSNSANVKSQNQVVKGIEDTAGSDFKIMTTLILILRYKLC